MGQLKRIVNFLLLNSSCLDNVGLFHGKMGICIFFYNYSRYTNSELYSEFAGLLLDEVFEEIYLCDSIHFENGFSGIGWAIEYLIFNKFVKGDANEILFELDQKIMEIDIKRLQNLSFRNGIEGIVYYVLCRLINMKKDKYNIPFDSLYLSELNDIVINLYSNNSCLSESTIIISYMNYIKSQPSSDFNISIPLYYIDSTSTINNIIEMPLGLDNGLAGIGLKEILR